MQDPGKTKITLSVIIVTKNESQNITACIGSVPFASEILVLDSGSTDDTVAQARAAGATVHSTDWPGYGLQQLRGIQMAKSDWVLSLDADERISAELAAELLAAISNPKADGYRLPRSSSFCGQFMRAGGWVPDYTLRLVKREAAGFSDHFLHAHMTVDGTRADLANPIIHYSYRNLDDVLEKLNRYSRGSAVDLLEQGVRSNLSKALLKGFSAFARTYILRRGFMDGQMGLVLAIFNAETTYYKYLRLHLRRDTP
ncbi:MAG: glycosyltransferase family 2 protein [Polaromonas sp.]|nr:glycosyltransferase family 2 protein [Polaromonas sp.]